MAIVTKPWDDDAPTPGIRKLWHFDTETEQVTEETIFDAEPLLELNKAAYNSRDGNFKGEFHHVASIPMEIYMDLKKRGIVDDKAAMKRWLNDRDNRLFRTKPGVV